jgi:hypothetical protein
MKSNLFTAAFLSACTFVFMSTSRVQQRQSPQTVIDFSVQRLSGKRVQISWHTRNEKEQVQFEVMRRFGRTVPFAPIGSVQQKLQTGINDIVDYSFVDEKNMNPDTSFYCVKKTDAEGVIFYSLPKAVEGAGKSER